MAKDDEIKRLAALGGRIRKARKTIGLTLHQLARLSGISAPALSHVERGKRDLRVTTLCRIADALRVAMSDLLEDPKEQSAIAPSGRNKGYHPGDHV